jgi:DNA modification methylase
MKIEQIKTEKLIPYARNSRLHSQEQIAQISASIREFGFNNPVLIDKDNGIIAGHGRVLAAQKLGLDEVPCLRLSHLTDIQKRAYIIADNRLAETGGGWDTELLALEIEDLRLEDFDIDLTGFDAAALSDLFSDGLVGESEGLTDPDDAPDLQENPTTKFGDIWLLGNHRLICGDSTSNQTLLKLMSDSLADLCWTDPPYNVAYETKAGKIENDNLSDDKFRKFLYGFYSATHAVMKDGAAIYVAHADTERANFTSEFLSAGFKLSGVIIWKKDSLVLGRSDYQWIHEPILYGWKKGSSHKFFGGRKQTTVAELEINNSPFTVRADGLYQITIGDEIFIIDGAAKIENILSTMIKEPKPKRSDVHPTMKPTSLISRMLKNSAKPGSIVIDPFGGSGSTLIACEQLGMSARLCELSEKYCDVIIRRWCEYTGNDAILESTGEAFPS